MKTNTDKRIYLDYAATTPLDPLVEKAMLPYLQEEFGNPSSLHSFGQEAIGALDEARGKIAEELGVSFNEIIFTGSATEANNLVLRGVIKQHGGVQLPQVGKPNIIISSIEHPSVFETAYDLERDGVEIRELPVDKEGVVNLDELKEKLDESTLLVSVMYANNEVGTLQPITEIANMVRDFRNSKIQKTNPKKNSKSNTQISKNWNLEFGAWNLPAEYPLVHTDAVQAFQYFPCSPEDLGLDFMTLSGHKIYGPKGVGLLFARDPSTLSSVITGGAQEFGMRAGTENIPSLVAFAKAVELASGKREEEYERMKKLGSYFRKEIKKIDQKIEVNGAVIGKGLPNIHNLYFPSRKARELLVKLDMAGVAVSAGSACKARASRASRVITSMHSSERAESSLRFSFGRFTTKEEIDRALPLIKKSL